MNNKEIALFLYQQQVDREKPVENPEGESLALLELFREINALGYDYHYMADLNLRKITDAGVMRLLWKYLPRMESIFTIETFIRKIDPKKVPEVFVYAIETFPSFSPTTKKAMTGFDTAISRGKRSEEYFARISKLLEDGDSYATLLETRKTLGKHRPDLLRKHTERYRKGVLLPLTLRDCLFFPDEETTAFLEWCTEITEDELTAVAGCFDYKNNGYRYPLSVTIFEEWQRLCTTENVQKEAKAILRKREKRMLRDL